jgi:hypothetical protein
MKKGKTSTSKNKIFKEDTIQFYRYMRLNTTEIEDHPHMEETELY